MIFLSSAACTVRHLLMQATLTTTSLFFHLPVLICSHQQASLCFLRNGKYIFPCGTATTIALPFSPIFVFWQTNAAFIFLCKGTHQLLKINDPNCLNLTPLWALQLLFIDVCFWNDTHIVFLGQSIVARVRGRHVWQLWRISCEFQIGLESAQS